MKIAVVSENGKTISQHFGKATQYVIVNTRAGRILSKEIRQKAGHADFMAAGDADASKCGAHSGDSSIYDRHRRMILNILDCSVLLSGCMGWGAYEGLKSRGIKTILTDVEDIEEAVNLYLEGNLPNLTERLH